MKKFISLILALCCVFSLSVTAFATQNLGAYDDSPAFDYQNYLRNLEKEKAMNQKFSVMRAASVSVPMHCYSQIVSYFCGPASAYMVLKSLGFSVSSSTKSLYFYKECQTGCNYVYQHQCYKSYTSPQVTLANEAGTGFGGTGTSSLKDTINSHLGTNYYSICSVSSTSSNSPSIGSKIYSTLSDGYPLIALVNAKSLDHYGGSNVGQTFGAHYVCIYSINVTTGKVGISDCNYYPGFGGNYIEDKDVLQNAIAETKSTYNLIW